MNTQVPTSSRILEQLSCSGVCGDPHLYLAHGGRTDFKGKDGQLYNFLSSKNVSLNVRIKYSTFMLNKLKVHGSFMTEAHMSLITDKGRFFNLSYVANRLNNENWAWNMVTGSCGYSDNRKMFIPMGPRRMKACDNLFASTDMSSLKVKTEEWTIGIHGKPIYNPIWGPTHRIDVQFYQLKPYKDFITPPHGIVGQSFDGDDIPRWGKIDEYPSLTEPGVFNTSAMGEGAIDGKANDYEVFYNYSTVFKYSRFKRIVPLSKYNRTQWGNIHSALATEHDEERRQEEGIIRANQME